MEKSKKKFRKKSNFNKHTVFNNHTGWIFFPKIINVRYQISTYGLDFGPKKLSVHCTTIRYCRVQNGQNFTKTLQIVRSQNTANVRKKFSILKKFKFFKMIKVECSSWFLRFVSQVDSVCGLWEVSTLATIGPTLLSANWASQHDETQTSKTNYCTSLLSF